MKRESSAVIITGLYRRGQVWWWNFQHDGHRSRVFLETEDRSKALRKVLEDPSRKYPIEIHIPRTGS